MILDVVAAILLVLGVAFLAISAVGLLKFPDFYSRTHVVAKSETLGLLLVFAGLIVHNRAGPGTAQLVLIAVFSFLVNPTAMHALSRTAFRGGLVPWSLAGAGRGEAGRADAGRGDDAAGSSGDALRARAAGDPDASATGERSDP